MRLLHTADWHLGHRIRDWDRSREHEAFLSWLVELLAEHRPDLLLVAGDVFDSVNPSAEAHRLFYSFLRDARQRLPSLEVVVLGGNHDSVDRLEAPRPLLDALGVRVVGGLMRQGGSVDVGQHLLRITDPDNRAFWVGCVPFLRPSDLPRSCPDLDGDPLIEGVRAIYGELAAGVRARRCPGEPVIYTGHLYLVGGLLSEQSERAILGGHQHALPQDVIPADAAYVALGHLHRPQAVGGVSHVRYAGSPLPLSITERHYRHQVCLVELDCHGVTRMEPQVVPRTVDMVRIPSQGALTLGEVEAALGALPGAGELPAWRWPYVDLHVTFDRPDPTLLYRVERVLEDRAARLVRVARERPESVTALGVPHQPSLAELAPAELLRRLHRERHGTEPSLRLLAAFHELLETVEREGQ